ncbi:Uncharacterised protein [Yersinia massiliensis]|jgi:hypothetical protein|nr:Uncharacterised protein [Yersinia massiliensis]CNL76343.1 Uncharacterised protein [Yersinia frederiksenii]
MIKLFSLYYTAGESFIVLANGGETALTYHDGYFKLYLCDEI